MASGGLGIPVVIDLVGKFTGTGTIGHARPADQQGVPWTLSDGAGPKTVYMQALDASGTWGNVDSDDNDCRASITYQP